MLTQATMIYENYSTFTGACYIARCVKWTENCLLLPADFFMFLSSVILTTSSFYSQF